MFSSEGFSSRQSCCRISVFRADYPRPRSETQVESPAFAERLPVPTDLVSMGPLVGARRTVDSLRPPGDPPLFVLHSAYLI